MTRSTRAVRVCVCPTCAEHPRGKLAREHKVINALIGSLDEKMARRLAGLLARKERHGGITLMSKVTGMGRRTILIGMRELEAGHDPFPDRVRRPGAGRPPKEVEDPELKRRFDALVVEDGGGAPDSARKWVRKSTRKVAAELSRAGHKVDHSTIGRWLRRDGFHLRSNRKRLATSSPQRDKQFQMIKRTRARFVRRGDPVVSVDSKKRELVGNYKNAGREWRKAHRDVNMYDFPTKKTPIGIPYGIYDVEQDEGFVVVGTSKNTPQFSVGALRIWWRERGRRTYPDACRLLILADGGGSNGSRAKTWKAELKRFSDETGLEIQVAHYPPGASKWNPVEHRLFSQLAINWQAQPLKDYRTMTKLIRGTRTESGLRVRAWVDLRCWKTGVSLPEPTGSMRRSRVLPAWNYTIKSASPRRKMKQ